MHMKILLILMMTANLNLISVSADDSVKLEDVTKRFTYRYYNVLSAFPKIYKHIPKEENTERVHIAQFQGKDRKQKTDSSDYYKRRIELFFSGGDWMNHVRVFLVTDAAQVMEKDGKPLLYSDGRMRTRSAGSARAYYVLDLSTSDYENGKTPPKVDLWKGDEGFSAKRTMEYYRTTFLDKNGWVKPQFVPLCNPDSYTPLPAQQPCMDGTRLQDYIK